MTLSFGVSAEPVAVSQACERPSAPAATARPPSLEKATKSASAGFAHSRRPVEPSSRAMVLLSAESALPPSGENATEVTHSTCLFGAGAEGAPSAASPGPRNLR